MFGTYGNRVDLTAVSADAIAYVQVGGVVAGHVMGVTLAHEQALRIAPRAPASDHLDPVAGFVIAASAVHGGRESCEGAWPRTTTPVPPGVTSSR